MVEIFAVLIGFLVGMGMWFGIYYGFDMSDWVSAVRVMAQWGLPMLGGISAMVTVFLVYNDKK